MVDTTTSKTQALRAAISNVIAQSIQARSKETGTLILTIEVNMSQGGIGQTYITEQFRKKLT